LIGGQECYHPHNIPINGLAARITNGVIETCPAGRCVSRRLVAPLVYVRHVENPERVAVDVSLSAMSRVAWLMGRPFDPDQGKGNLLYVNHVSINIH
jgi:hypothetical protein